MADVHLIDAEKGGVGKSLVARTLLQLFLDRECPVIPMEADRSNPTFSNIYGEQVLPAIFSEDREYEDAPDAVFDIALKTPVIVDLPAQAHRPLSLWLKSNRHSVLVNGAMLNYANTLTSIKLESDYGQCTFD